jgi:hypothetical protein
MSLTNQLNRLMKPPNLTNMAAVPNTLEPLLATYAYGRIPINTRFEFDIFEKPVACDMMRA